jgi:hypothetical protein
VSNIRIRNVVFCDKSILEYASVTILLHEDNKLSRYDMHASAIIIMQ